MIKTLVLAAVAALFVTFSPVSIAQTQTACSGEVLTDSGYAGVWYDPSAPGQGVLIEETFGEIGECGGVPKLTVFWFGYDFTEVSQAWYISESRDAGRKDTFPLSIYRPAGVFPAIGFDLGKEVGQISASLNKDGTLNFSYDFTTGYDEYCANGGRNDFSPRPPTPAECVGEFVFSRID